MQTLQQNIELLWENNSQEEITTHSKDIQQAISLIDSGQIRIASREENGQWTVHEWVKKAILLYFKLQKTSLSQKEGAGNFYDKIPLKTLNWQEENFKSAGFRLVEGAVVRYGSYIAKDSVVMPSFINIGAYVDEGTMVDTWATIGSCAQIGKRCHISGGAGIGGVLEPLSAKPVIVEDNVFIGARSELAEGVIVRKGAVLSMGVYIGASTKIIDRNTKEVLYGEVPENAVVVPGSILGENGISTYAAVIVKRVDERTRSKIGLNEILRGI